jgi:hypothetical protein
MQGPFYFRKRGPKETKDSVPVRFGERRPTNPLHAAGLRFNESRGRLATWTADRNVLSVKDND